MVPHRNGMMGLAHIGWSMPAELPKLPERLAEAGYRTTLVGIQHEGIEEDRRHGYQRVVKPEKGRNSAPEVGESAVRELEALAQDGETPFYLAVGFWETHRPFDRVPGAERVGERAAPPYLPDDPDIRREMGQFAHAARQLDEGVARIVAAVDRLGLAENTLVIYTTDHGIAFPRAKGTLFDPGLETALLMRWSGRVKPGQARSEMISNVDLFPTLCELAGAEVPEGIDGRSFAGALLGEPGEHRDHLFAELTWHDAYNPVRGVRTREHKYIRHFARGPAVYIPLDIHMGLAGRAVRETYYAKECPQEELYDLANDPLERVNVAAKPKYAAVLGELRDRVARWMARTEDPLLQGGVPGREAPGWEKERAEGRMPF